MTQNHVRRGFGKIQKSCQTKKLGIFFNEAGQNLVESVQNSKRNRTISGNSYYLV